MDASKKTKISNSRALYTPPCVVRISDLKPGEGMPPPQCSTGSGDAGCANGPQATVDCNTGSGVPNQR